MIKYINKNTCYIDDSVVIEDDVTIYPNVVILGNTTIKSNTIIYPNTTIENSIIGENNIIRNSNILNSNIGNNNNIGPNAYLRNNTVISNNCNIGFSVEIKNSKIDDGTKIAHLTYIGDAKIGKNVNFGAGVKIANYDGVKKYNTTILDNVFIGCNSVLVAPVIIEENSLIAAGSVITKDVPKNCLAIARQHQINKENYYSKREM